MRFSVFWSAARLLFVFLVFATKNECANSSLLSMKSSLMRFSRDETARAPVYRFKPSHKLYQHTTNRDVKVLSEAISPSSQLSVLELALCGGELILSLNPSCTWWYIICCSIGFSFCWFCYASYWHYQNISTNIGDNCVSIRGGCSNISTIRSTWLLSGSWTLRPCRWHQRSN